MRRTLRHALHAALPAVVACGLALVVPAVATAQADGTPNGDQRYPVGGAAIETAKSIASAHWGANPCSGQYTITWTPLDPGTNATASWRNPTDAWNNPVANFDCRIDVNTQADFDYPKLCTVLTHEIGHLAGQQHDPNPGTLMSAYYSSPLPACRTGDPAAPPPVPPVAQTAQQNADGIDIVATDEQPRRTLRRKTTRRTKYRYRYKTVRRCVLRKAASGKRVKRCRTVRVKVRVKAGKAAKTKTRTTRARKAARAKR